MDAKATYINNCINQLSNDQLRIEAIYTGIDPTLPKERICEILSEKYYQLPTPPSYPPPPIPIETNSLPIVEPFPSEVLNYEIPVPNYLPPPIPQVCSFCCEVQTIRSRYKTNSPKYCSENGSCAICQPSNYNMAGTNDQIEFARDIFRGIVLDIETKNIYNDMVSKTNFLYNSNFMTPEQHANLINSIYLYKDRYEEFVNDVINDNRYKEPASSGGSYIYLTGSFEWSQAIIILRNWFVTHFQEEFQSILSSYQSPSQEMLLNNYCKNLQGDKCEKPCTQQKGFRRNTCKYIKP